MISNTKQCSVSFKYQDIDYNSGFWSLLHANFSNKIKEYSPINTCWRQLTTDGVSACSIGISSVRHSDNIYEPLLLIHQSKKPHKFFMEIDGKWCLSGMFIINKLSLEVDKSGLLQTKLNLESYGEVHNEYNKIN